MRGKFLTGCVFFAAAIMSHGLTPPAESFDSVDGTLAFEDFDSYGDLCPLANAGFYVVEEQLGKKHLFRKAEKPLWVFATNWPAALAGRKLRDYEFSFKFRFTDHEKDFQLRLDSESAGKVFNHTLTFLTNSIALSGLKDDWFGAQRAVFGDSGIPDFKKNRWYRCVVRVYGDSLRVLLDDRGELVKVAENTFPEATFAGLNFLVNKPLNLTCLRIRELKGISERTGQAENGLIEAKAPIEHKLTVPSGMNAAGAYFIAGMAPGARILINWNNGQSNKLISTKVESDCFERKVEGGGTERVVLPDAVIAFNGLNVKYHSRPYARRYTDDQQDILEKNWNAFPAASKRLIHFEARLDKQGVQIWIDGRYCGRLDNESGLKDIVFRLPSGSVIRDAGAYKSAGDARYLRLNTARIASPGIMKDAKVSPAPGEKEIGGVPIIVVGGADSADVGVVKQMKGSYALENDEYLSRTALDGMPESLHFSVPRGYWNRAWVLCAAETDPKKDAVLTVRLTRFGDSGRGDAIADTTLTLPRGGEPPALGLTKAGSVAYKVNGASVTVPLWLAEIRINPGDVLDLLTNVEDPYAAMRKIGPYLDFEFLGKRDRLYQAMDRRHKPDIKSISGVHVFGVTLERSPVEFSLAPSQPGNIFHNDEKPETMAIMRADEKGVYELKWDIIDVAGKVLKSDKARVDLQAGVEQKIVIPLAMPKVGWYGLDFIVCDAKGCALLKHDAAFALLGKDTREAGYESPYGTWWFGSAHYGCSDQNIIGPMLFKAGLRKTTFNWSKLSEQDFAPWKVTHNQLSWPPLAQKDMENGEKAYAKAEEKVRKQLERFPHCRSALIFHESYGDYIPAELRDVPQVDDEKTAEIHKKRAEFGAFAARFYREKFPDIKLVVGNSGSSSSAIASLLRYGFDPKYIDYIGIENAGQTIAPEKPLLFTTQGTWFSREVARKFGHDLPVTACFEFTYRTDRDLGIKRQAEWYVRDMLLGHAYKFDHINPGMIHDPGNSYYNTLWGNPGFCRRSPLLYPKPSYVAVATLTKVLDKVRLNRQVSTGSATVFALEFDRGDKKIYAFWTPRGEASLELDFDRDVELTGVSFYGAEERFNTRNGRITERVSTSPSYLVAPVALKTAQVIERSYPRDVPGQDLKIVNAMNKEEEWELDRGDRSLESADRNYQPLLTAGNFVLRKVEDPEKGACLELELNPLAGKKTPYIVGEYAVMRLKTPSPVPGKPNTIGVWVKGNSGWGGIIWEFVDAEGEVWRSSGTGGWGCSVLDWVGEADVNFDGWNFLRFPLTEESSARTIHPNVVSQWVCTGGNKRIDYPIKLSGLCVAMYRKALDLTELKPVPELKLRFVNLGALDY